MPKDDTIVLIRPGKYDDALEYAYELTDPVVVEAERVGLDVTELALDDANLFNIMSTLNEVDPNLVYGVGHGCASVYTAEYLQDVFWTPPGCSGGHSHSDSNLSVLNGRYVHLLSCLCGLRLGQAMVNAGASGFQGYSVTWSWVIDEKVAPTEDQFATSFFTCDNKFMIKLFAGQTPETAFKKMIEEYNEQIKYWEGWLKENTDATPYERARAMLCVELLEIDRDGAVHFLEIIQPQPVQMGGLILPAMMFAGGWAVKKISGK